MSYTFVKVTILKKTVIMRQKLQHSAVASLIGVASFFQPMLAQGVYVSGDFHQHTTYTDGSYTFGYMMNKNNQYGLDWWANSEHGGGFSKWAIASGADLGTEVTWSEAGIAKLGKANGENMWRWQSLQEWSFRDVLLYRKVFPTKTLIQGYEWNAPGYEHVDVCIINNQFDANPNCNPLSEFEYKFDNNDSDDSNPNGWTKATQTSKAKTVEAITWMQANYPATSWIVPTYPERANAFKIQDFRDMNNAGPSVCFGFDSQSGHQKSSNRGGLNTGSYGSTGTVTGVDGATWGGTGAFSAKIGGVWDALLSEGRSWWLFANSDCHYVDGDFFPGEYQKTKTLVAAKNNPQMIVDGLRSGNSYIVMGDLIDSLNFKVGTASMGQNFSTTSDKATISIIVHDPQGSNFNTYSSFTNPELDHIDLIAGTVSSKIDPASPDYSVGTVSTTSVIARFGKTASTNGGITTQVWTDLGNGYKQITYEATVTGKMYFRLRGTHHAFGAADTQIDADGNPLVDPFGTNNAAKAFEDLWFYSNPVYVEKTGVTSAPAIKSDKMTVFPNPANEMLNITFAKAQSGEISLSDLSGKCVLKSILNEESTKQISVRGLSKGVYVLNAVGYFQKVVVE